ncbi:PspA/IM30 family protein [Petroclostridium sp. X23]|uniref:PspA/IM30 family protein n=1 Tax=Petroclostridium sp. X23 TaxID=3045146 RepID=UPI0024ACBA31|nr:PspA/IM30 family protein [Petroclostridium sp. X23]WHH59962.1 PspA/IM30 family protein [Petroclostridium sp. X23]
MGILGKVKSIFKAKANSILDEIENPEEALQLSLEEMKEQVNKIKKSLIEVATIKKKLESDLFDVKGKIKLASEQAELSIASNREDLAKAALEKKQDLLSQEERITAEIQQLNQKIKIITNSKEQLEYQINDLENRKEELIAMNRAADAQITVKETITGISNEMNDIHSRIDRAENKIRQKNAKISAMDELIELNALDTFDGKDSIEKELSKLQKEEKVRQELEALKQRKGVS